jgi:hypothetical protein
MPYVISLPVCSYISTMRDPGRFPRAAALALTIMFAMYLVIACVAYPLLGRELDLERPLTSLLPKVVSLSLLLHAGTWETC